VKQLSKHDKAKVRKAQLQGNVYAVICLAASWLVAFALTGSVLRSFMFIVALALIVISTGQYHTISHRIRLITMSPDMQTFDDWIASGTAGEDLRAGDAVHRAEDGTMKKINSEKPE